METYLLIPVILVFLVLAGTSFILAKKVNVLHRKNSELELKIVEKHQDLLGKAKYSELGMMVAGITHELNNLMTIIQARVTQILRQYRSPEKEKEVALGLNQIVYTIERMSKTVQGIRQFVHTNKDDNDDVLSLSEMFEDVLLFCSQRLKNHGIELKIKGAEGAYTKGHKIHLEQAFINLINNAFDAVDNLDNKWIEVSVIKGEENLDMYFKDSGFGIQPKVVDKMMDPFYTTKSSNGTGLGLSFVKSIAEQHGGSFTYVDKGFNTTFLLTLPKASEEDTLEIPHQFDRPDSDIHPIS